MGAIVTEEEIPTSLIKSFIANFIIVDIVTANIMDKVEVNIIVIDIIDCSLQNYYSLACYFCQICYFN